MGNLDFLEKKTKYAISWDGIIEGKETFTNKGFNNDDPADTWCKVSEYYPKEGSFVKTVGKIVSAHGFKYNINVSECYEAIVSRFMSDKYEAITIEFDVGNVVIVHCDIDKCLIPERSSFQYNSITFPTAGWWVKTTMKGINPVGALGTLMTISTAPRFVFSGKGFTSPQKPYRYISRSFEPDDDICIWIDGSKIHEDTKGYKNGFNAFCIPGDFNLEADIKLDKALSDIYKHSMNLTLSAYLVNWLGDPTPYYANIELGESNHMLVEYDKIDTNPEVINGLSIKLNGIRVYFNPAITIEEFKEWWEKYFPMNP